MTNGKDTEEITIAVTLRLPKGHYQVASALVNIYDCTNFDGYVSDTIKEDIERISEDPQILNDAICERLTGKPNKLGEVLV